MHVFQAEIQEISGVLTEDNNMDSEDMEFADFPMKTEM